MALVSTRAERKVFRKIEAELEKIETKLDKFDWNLKSLVWQYKIDTEKIIIKIQKHHGLVIAKIQDVFNELLEFESGPPQE